MAAALPMYVDSSESDDWSDFADSQRTLAPAASWEFGSFEDAFGDTSVATSVESRYVDTFRDAMVRASGDPLALLGAFALGSGDAAQCDGKRSPTDATAYSAGHQRQLIASLPSLSDFVEGSRTWRSLAKSIGNARPVDWIKCRAREAQLGALQLCETQVVATQNFDISDDEELMRAFDVHCIVTSKARNSDDDDLATAEEVISEIDNIIRMQESMMTVTTDDGYMTEGDMMSSAGSDCLYFRETPGVMQTSQTYEDTHAGLKQMSCLRLNELLDDVQSAVEERSRTLMRELTLRDELEYELELKNQFITLCHNVMKKQKTRARGGGNDTAAAAAAAAGGSQPAKGRGAAVSATSATSTLASRLAVGSATTTTVAATGSASISPKVIKKSASSKGHDRPPSSTSYHIPYELRKGPPDADLLAIYIKILDAMYKDSPNVPVLLTDYILKVVCPT